jgi:hypothetical protein
MAKRMNAATKQSVVLAGLTLSFLALAGAFWFNVWGRSPHPSSIPPVDPQFTNVATVRLSAAELMRTGGDTSGLSCYACHDIKKTVNLHLDTNGNIVLPEEHKDLVIRHGRNSRNNQCFNCHDSTNLELLRTRDGRQLKVEESTKLCASCHGPTYRDWEVGIHGRPSGYWSQQHGAVTRQDCTSCHDPHAPAFPSMKPGPGPHPLHANPTRKEGH